VFKFPGGLSEPGEGLDECVKREVYEETGVRTQFEGVIGLRHMHGLAFGVSDVYCITLLRPLTHAITIDPGEIAEGVWSDGEAFVATTTHPLMKIAGRKALAVARQRGWIKGSGGSVGGEDDVMDRHHVYSTISKKWTSVYLTGSPPEEEFLQALKHVPQGILPPVERLPWEGVGGGNSS
jgi:ADP-ribose pyrophosphatase YjhB (NUDIX family)